MIEDGTILALMGLVLVVSFASLWTGIGIRNAKRRTEDLEEVAKAMQDHYEALQKLLESDDLSERLKSALYKMHKVTMNREAAPHVVHKLMVLDDADSRDFDRELDQELHKLSKKSADLFDAVRVVTKSGIFVALLRWPDTANKAREIMMSVTLDGKKESLATRSMLAVNANLENNDRSVPGGLATA